MCAGKYGYAIVYIFVLSLYMYTCTIYNYNNTITFEICITLYVHNTIGKYMVAHIGGQNGEVKFTPADYIRQLISSR